MIFNRLRLNIINPNQKKMKKIFCVISLFTVLSCDKNCDDEIKEVTEQYKKALGYTGGSSAAVIRLTEQYNEKLAEINKRCN